ncbi:sensor histidine kinase [Archangium sp.]|uniref:sensor histidine kinase n=1 Tax=Archangium sp. TaxID=1872627 RepID=UPI002D242D27|nr:ATP-binding protein [Archangium sp.]HYO56410.1 ATP-binding protein [Archangium sp.]
MSTPLASNKEERQQWTQALVFAAAILLFYLMDLFILKRPSLATLLVRVGWAWVMILSAWLSRRVDARRVPLLTRIDGILTSAFFLGIVYFTGGSGSPYMMLVPSMPLLIGLTQPQDARLVILSGVTCALGTLVIMLLTDNHALQALAWASMVGVATFFGVYGSQQFRKVQAARNEARLERARRESMEKQAMAARHRAQSEKLATVGRLAASVMHEINNPLAYVGSNLEFLRAEVLAQQLPEKARQELQEVFDETRTGVERIRQIVSDLKGFSRMDADEPSECSLADVVTDAARLAAMKLKHVARLKVEVPAELPVVFATRRRLAQVMLNLLVNAGDALEEAKVQGGEVRVTGVAESGRVTLLVEDNGPGFPPEVLPRLFDAFFTTKGPEKGTGLGLSISRELVERFGGTLRAENRPEGGARLRLELPVHKAPLPPGEGRGEGI